MTAPAKGRFCFPPLEKSPQNRYTAGTMKCTPKKLEKSQIELTITVSPEEYQKQVERAAQEISEQVDVKGFRRGNAPYDMVKAAVGEMKIYEHALEYIVRRFYTDALAEQNIDAVGMPSISVEKLAPGNDIEFKATVAVLPEIKITAISKIKMEKGAKEINDTDIDRVLSDIQKMRSKEVLKSGPATAEDKVVVDMDMFYENVPVEGGQTRNHSIYLSEEYYIPGLQKELVGLKKDDEKEFSLTMPESHYQKHLAGKEVAFKIKINDVYTRELPALDDELAKGLGQESVAVLRELIGSNLRAEAEQKENQRVEITILDQLIDGSTISDVPEVLIEAERDKMFYELKRGLEQQGMEMEAYLASVKRTTEELAAGFTEQATRRAKAALISRAIAKEQNLAPTKEEIETELVAIRETYKDNAEAQKNLERPEVRDTVATLIRNRKVISWLKDKVLGEAK